MKATYIEHNHVVMEMNAIRLLSHVNARLTVSLLHLFKWKWYSTEYKNGQLTTKTHTHHVQKQQAKYMAQDELSKPVLISLKEVIIQWHYYQSYSDYPFAS